MEDKYLDRVFYNNNGREFKVIELVHKTNKNAYYKVRFTETGYETVLIPNQIKVGAIKDRFYPEVAGVGYTGNIYCSRNSRLHSVWHNMIHRCYNPKSTEYKRYGAKGVTVCERWHCLQHFAEDLLKIEGYNEELFNKGLIYLDKDLKQQYVQNKVYSLETCIFLTAKQNADLVNEQRRYNFKAVDPKGKEYFSRNLPDFCKEHELNTKQALNVINGWQHTHKGWKFIKLEESATTISEESTQ
jgi:hypothetical protein